MKYETRLKEKAKENQGTRTDILQNSVKSSEPVNTQKELAKVAGVSHDTIHKVKIIQEQGIEPLQDMARSEEISINAASITVGKVFHTLKTSSLKSAIFTLSSGKEGQFSGYKWDGISHSHIGEGIFSGNVSLKTHRYTINYPSYSQLSLHNNYYRTVPYLCGLTGGSDLSHHAFPKFSPTYGLFLTVFRDFASPFINQYSLLTSNIEGE